jgi:uncharacterized protein YbjT (DUF2867 family)
MIVITAPTGNMGHQVLDNVLAGDQPVRVIVRDPAKLPADVRDRVEVIQGSHGDPQVVARAFDGADALFWLLPTDHHAASVEEASQELQLVPCQATLALSRRRRR